MSEENKTTIRRLIEEVWNRRNPNIADELIAATHTNHDPASPDFGRGPEGYKRHFQTYVSAFPDLRLLIDSIVSEGDVVAARWTATGTHKGRLGDVAATGRPVAVTGITMARVSQGRVHESWLQWDALGLMRQIGAARLHSQAAGSHVTEL
jgi:steroid delta-isomerase-like uncharacterized protein